MAKFQKVSELEWYLHMQAFHRTFGGNTGYNSQGEVRMMDLNEFHEFWLTLRAPGYNKERDEVIFNAPFNIDFHLYPGQAMEIPLGFSIPQEFEIIQGKKDRYIVSVHRIPGLEGGIGDILRIVNIYDQACRYQCGAGEAMISGYLPREGAKKTKKKILIYDHVSQPEINIEDQYQKQAASGLIYPFPGVFQEDDVEDISHYYLAAEYDGSNACIHIMRIMAEKPDPLRDVPVCTYTPRDYSPDLMPTEAFRNRFLIATEGEEIIPRKKYVLTYDHVDIVDV